ncbi:MAG: SpvB/TcaC N-terminal domain-containing protein [Mycobacterium sp.]
MTGTGTLTVPLATSPGRSGFGPSLNLAYDSGNGNTPFGLGWELSLPAITRKTDKGLPRYDEEPDDTFVLSGAEDLVPVLQPCDEGWRDVTALRDVDDRTYLVRRYRPRIEGLFARIERWVDVDSGDTHWRSITPDNVTTLYGATPQSRIADPADPTRVFSWLTCESFDDSGNAIAYEYKAEDSEGVATDASHEYNRSPSDRSANRYLKRVRYGNRVSRLIQPDLTATDWMFETVFDYGDHDHEDPRPAEARPWRCRRDPFSTFRAGFEVRTYRLCRRVLVFHHFSDQADVGADCLVGSTDLNHRHDSVASFLDSVVQCRYRRLATGGYRRKSLPPLEFGYTAAVVDQRVHTLDPGSVENLPFGLDGSAFQWVDLDGEGLSGILTEQSDAWFYKPNLGGGRFGPMRLVGAKPSAAALGSGRQELLDLAGDGQLDLVEFGGPTPGFHERTSDLGWEGFRPFRFRPDIAWDDPNLRLVDLTGDGHADILISGDDVISWYPSLAETGFGPLRRTYHSLDEDRGPRVVIADADQTIYLADMSGDGLADLVRIRNGEVCYWPNLGYGRFGSRVVMDGSPQFDEPDHFDQRRLRIADVDGSGTTDLIYLHRDETRIYFNRSGNSWSPARSLTQSFPLIDSLSRVTAVDLLGNGTACLVWSSPLPSEAGRALRYVELMGAQKPHLLREIRNNLGAETRIHYAPSTRFYAADNALGRPWITRLPFPVHVVERVETFDRISHNRFVSRYAYHHGHYDGVEREFRGFAMVEQTDTEYFAAFNTGPQASNVDTATHAPPVLTRTWFHTGAEPMSRLAAGYFHESDHCSADQDELLLPDTVLPPNLSPGERRQACRALKGSVLRREVFALDGSTATGRPYTVTENNYTVQLLQPAEAGGYAVFITHPREAITANYERALYPVDGVLRADPRVSHEMALSVDEFGNVLRSVSIGYGRRHADPVLAAADRERQRRAHIIATEARYTNVVDETDAYRTPQLAETRALEILGLEPDACRPGCTNPFGLDELNTKLNAIRLELPVEEWDADPAVLPGPARRLIEHTRVLYRRDDLTGCLPLGRVEARCLPFESYRLALTPSLLADLYGGRVTGEVLTSEGGYVEADGAWWVPSGRMFYSPDAADAAGAELDHALRHFFLPHRFRTPFGATSTVTFDRYDLLVEETRDPVDNRITAENDYRVLAPRLMTDPNRNRSEVAFDTLGMVVGTAVMGKEAEHLGDSLTGFDPDPDEGLVAAYLADPLAEPHVLLQGATSRLVYDPFAYLRTRDCPQPQPAVVATLARETHRADLAAGERTKMQQSFSYSDGLGREIQKKLQAAPGPLDDDDEQHVGPRWVGSGWIVFNNKGAPIREFEPFFSASHRFEFDVRAGVSPVLFYDPVQRAVATLNPDDTWTKTVIDPWHQQSWDGNDTVLLDPCSDSDVGGFVTTHLDSSGEWRSWYQRRIGGRLGQQEQTAAKKAAAHANTPGQSWLDTLGRPFLSVAHNRTADGDMLLQTRLGVDVNGNEREVVDPKGRLIIRYGCDLLGGRVSQASMEAGQRLVFNDIDGQPVRSWNDRGFVFRTEYDALRRPNRSFVAGGGLSGELLRERTEYGEGQADDTRLNLRGTVFRHHDGSGVATNDACDFKGNTLMASRQLVRDCANAPDWSKDVELDERVFVSRNRFDALNRSTAAIAPDGTVVRATYNEANLLSGLEADLRGAVETTVFVADVDYNARGQRTACRYGNGARTEYEYDPFTFLPTSLRTLRNDKRLQDLGYTYDPVGNITHIRDEAQQTVFFRNRRVDPSTDYTYDAIYRLIEATGREHLGQGVGGGRDSCDDDSARTGLPQPGDGNAMGRYVERYLYDQVGNLLRMAHRGSDPIQPGWTRTYDYAEPSLLQPDQVSNRLTSTSDGGAARSQPFTYDAHGNVTSMPELPEMRWDMADYLQATARQVLHDGTPETTRYAYDSAGVRIRKVTERQAGPGTSPRRKSERIYLGGFEIYREYRADGSLDLERETLHLLDGEERVALVETRVEGNDDGPTQLQRFQIANHLGSATLELDGDGQIITYEEYSPYGSSTYQAVRSQTEVPKRYRYTAMERDEESGLEYHGARYYMPRLGRWNAADPAGLVDGQGLYTYARGNPVNLRDVSGTDSRIGTLVKYDKKGLGLGKDIHQLHFFPASILQKISPKWTYDLSDTLGELVYVAHRSLNDATDAKLRAYGRSIDKITDQKHFMRIVRDVQEIWRDAGVPQDIVRPWTKSAFSTAKDIGITRKPTGGAVFKRVPGGGLTSAILDKVDKFAKPLAVVAGVIVAGQALADVVNGDFGKAANRIGTFAYEQTIGPVVDAASAIKDIGEFIADPLAGIRESIEQIQREQDAMLDSFSFGTDEDTIQSAPAPSTTAAAPPAKRDRGTLYESLMLWSLAVGLAARAPSVADVDPTADKEDLGEIDCEGFDEIDFEGLNDFYYSCLPE